MSSTDTLATVPNATLTFSSLSSDGTETTLTGQLALESISFDVPPTAPATSAARTQDNLLVLVLRTGTGNDEEVAFEAPLGPTRAFTVFSVRPSRRRYVFHATRDDPGFTVEFATRDDDMELFHSVLEGYIAAIGGHGKLQPQSIPASPPAPGMVEETAESEEEDLRGRFVLMNEDDGEIVGTLDSSVRVHEDQSLAEKGHERDPVVVELPEGADTVDGLRDEEVLVRTIPSEERDWILKGAIFVCNAISGTTTRLTRAMTTASNSYIARSTPSTSSPSTPRPNTPPSPSSSSGPAPPPGPPLPPRKLPILQSPTAQRHLARINTFSDGAIRLSSKAAAAAGSLIPQDVGTSGSGGRGRAASIIAKVIKPPTPTPPTPPPRNHGSSFAPTTPTDNKPPPPPRHGKSLPSLPPSDSSVQSPALHPQSPTTPRSTRKSLALSAALILASLETSAGRLVEAGGAAVSAAVKHKYGPGVGENAALAVRAARNIVLVYVDVRGLCRPVTVKRMAKSWVQEQIAAAKRR